MAQKSLVNKNNGLWPSLLDCLFTGTRMNKVTKEFNKVGQGWAWTIQVNYEQSFLRSGNYNDPQSKPH